jgi:hypothetical protein
MVNLHNTTVANPQYECHQCEHCIGEPGFDFIGDRMVPTNDFYLWSCNHPVAEYIYNLPDRYRTWVYSIFGRPGKFCPLVSDGVGFRSIREVDEFIEEFKQGRSSIMLNKEQTTEDFYKLLYDKLYEEYRELLKEHYNLKYNLKSIVHAIAGFKQYSDGQDFGHYNARDMINQGRSDAYQDCIDELKTIITD